MKFEEFQILTSKIKKLPLPAESAQLKMAPSSRKGSIEKYRVAMKNAKQSAVLALFYPDINKYTKLALILRKPYNGVHSGQISFPGGKVEMNDINLEHTALRESNEEIGIDSNKVEIVKELSSVYIPPSNFTVQPYLGYVQKTPQFELQHDEVDELIEVSLQDLISDANVVKKSVSTSYKLKLKVPAFLFQGYVVWGATAMMLSEVKDLVKSAL